MTHTFSEWLNHYADATGLTDTATGNLSQDRTLIVHDVICTFVHPCGDQHELAVVLLDAGKISTAAAKEFAEIALSRNLENFLLGAPLFFVNPSSGYLVLGQKFEFAKIDPLSFAPLLDTLAQQAKSWRDEGSAA